MQVGPSSAADIPGAKGALLLGGEVRSNVVGSLLAVAGAASLSLRLATRMSCRPNTSSSMQRTDQIRAMLLMTLRKRESEQMAEMPHWSHNRRWTSSNFWRSGEESGLSHRRWEKSRVPAMLLRRDHHQAI